MNVSRTIAAMDDRLGRRDLALAAMTVVGLSRLIEPPALWLVAILLLVAMLFGTLQVLADESHPTLALAGVAIEALILPSVAAVACLGAIRLVPFGLWLDPGAHRDRAARRAGAGDRGAASTPTGRPVDRRPDVAAGHDPARRVPRVHRRRRDGARAASSSRPPTAASRPPSPRRTC